MLAGDERADVGVLVARVAELALRHAREEALVELVRDRLLHEQAGAGEADLAGVVVLVGRGLDRRVEIGVGEDHERALAAELEARPGVRFGGGGARDDRGGLVRAGEGDARDARVGGERGADLLAVALDDVEHARRQPGLGGDVREQRAR